MHPLYEEHADVEKPDSRMIMNHDRTEETAHTIQPDSSRRREFEQQPYQTKLKTTIAINNQPATYKKFCQTFDENGVPKCVSMHNKKRKVYNSAKVSRYMHRCIFVCTLKSIHVSCYITRHGLSIMKICHLMRSSWLLPLEKRWCLNSVRKLKG